MSADDVGLLARRLRQARRDAGLSQQRVSDETRIPRTAVSDIERGRRGVNALELRNLTRLYGVGIDHILDLEEGAGPPPSAAAAVAARLAPIWSELSPVDQKTVLNYAAFLGTRH